MRYAANLDRWSQCLLIPGRYHDDDGWVIGDGIIEGMQGDIQRAVSIKAIREAAARIPQVGLRPVEDVEALTADGLRLQAELDRANARVAELEAKFERIQGLSKDGFKVQRQQGRPPQREAHKREAVKT